MPSRPPKPSSDPYPPGWEPFLAAICASPDDDTARLVFADWLQENGDEPRGEFIRLQCQVAQGDADAATAAEVLLGEHQKRWLGGWPKVFLAHPDRCVFRRGFVAALTATGRQWVADGEVIRRLTPLEELRMEQPYNTAVEVPAIAGIRALTVTGAGSALIESLARSPALPALTDLAIEAKSSDGVSQGSFHRLLGNAQLARLRRLRLQSVRLGSLIAEGLTAPHFSGLEALRLPHLRLDATGAAVLARLPATGLRVLDLLNNQIGDAGRFHLLASPGLRNLEELGLRSCHLTSASARALASWEGLRSVRRLDVGDNRLRPADVQVIRNSPHAANLTDLTVR